EAPFGHAHACQSLKSHDLGRVDAHDGLVMGDHAVFQHGLVEAAHDANPFQHGGAQVRLEPDVAAAAHFLGVVEREIGVLKEGGGVGTVGAEQCAAKSYMGINGMVPSLDQSTNGGK